MPLDPAPSHSAPLARITSDHKMTLLNKITLQVMVPKGRYPSFKWVCLKTLALGDLCVLGVSMLPKGIRNEPMIQA